MSERATPPHIDVRQWCQAGRQLVGQNLLSSYERLMLETKGQGAENPVEWSVRTEFSTDQSGQSQAWLHLEVDLDLPLTCQRCLGTVNERGHIQRSYRFVDTEAQAEQQDDESEVDLLVISRDFDLAALIEDEILMDMPVVPRHEVCPVAVKLTTVDPGFEAASVKPNPFSALAALKAKPDTSG
jgi:uncharacterized protein